MAGSERSSGWLPGLLCLALAVLMWWGGEAWREQRQAQAQQLGTTKRLLAHRDSESAESLDAQRRAAAARRQALAVRLGKGESLEMARAQLVYDVRQRCYEIKLNCQIRLADALASTTVAKPDDPGADPLAGLGIQRVRAVVTGNLDGQDIAALSEIFQQDAQRLWRVNRVQIKAKSFEMDVERHLLAAGG